MTGSAARRNLRGMSAHAWIVAVASTPFRRWPERSFRDLGREVVTGALADLGARVTDLDSVWFGNCAMGVWGQSNIRGQTVLDPLMREGLLPAGTPVGNVEGGCATGSLALGAAVRDVLAGADLSLALGVEKVFVPDDVAKTFGVFAGGADREHQDEWLGFVAAAAERGGQAFEPHPARIVFLDIHALQARDHMARHGTTVEQIAAVAAKNHGHSQGNPRAQYRVPMTVEQVLADKPVVAPLTRSMCSPISDGAAAAFVASDAWIQRNPAARERAIRVAACSFAGGTWRELDGVGIVERAAKKAYEAAGISGADVDLAEVHDATAYCELAAYEGLGFCGVGESGAYAESGATERGGSRPVNVSGGLVSKGHPLGATGLGMVQELVLQLRGEAGELQVPGEPVIAVAQNAGGLTAIDEALCGVTVLARG